MLQIQPKALSKKVGMTITMKSINGGFGFRIVGGRDINVEMIPQVDLVAPGKLRLVCCHTTVSCSLIPFTVYHASVHS